MSDTTEQSARIEDAAMEAAKAVRERSGDMQTKLDRLWALRCDGELIVNFSKTFLPGPKRDHLWTVICNADRQCMDARDAGIWLEKPLRDLHGACAV